MKQIQNEKLSEPRPVARLLASVLAAGIEEAALEIIVESNGVIAEVVCVRRNNEHVVNHFRFSHALFLQIVELVKERAKNETRRRPWDSSSVFMLEMANYEVGLEFYQCIDAHFTESESKHTLVLKPWQVKTSRNIGYHAMLDMLPDVEFFSFGQDDFLSLASEEDTCIAKGKKSDFRSGDEFQKTIREHLLCFSDPENSKKLEKDEYSELVRSYIGGLKHPFKINEESFVGAELLYQEWDEIQVLAEFQDHYLFFLWYTTA